MCVFVNETINFFGSFEDLEWMNEDIVGQKGSILGIRG